MQRRPLRSVRRLTRLAGLSLAGLSLAGLALVLTGCVEPSPACADMPAEIEVALSAETLTPSAIAVCRDAEVTLVVMPEVDGVLHIHGNDDEIPATSVTAGEVVEIAFTATRSGQFPIELHTDENAQGANVGLLTVHEP